MGEIDEVNTRLHQVRTDAGLSSRAFARRISAEMEGSVSHTAVQNRERGGTVPCSYAAAVCSSLGVHPVWLLLGEGPRRWVRSDEGARRREVVASWLEARAEELREG